MKTAMQIMYDELLANEYTIPLDLIVKCKELLAMEREQIVKAYTDTLEFTPENISKGELYYDLNYLP